MGAAALLATALAAGGPLPAASAAGAGGAPAATTDATSAAAGAARASARIAAAAPTSPRDTPVHPRWRGRVRAAGEPLAGTEVTLRRAQSGRRTAAILGATRTDGRGRFTLRPTAPLRRSDVVYLTARGGSLTTGSVPAALELASVAGTRRPGRVRIDERTTVAAAAATAQFQESGLLRGPAPGLPNAAAMSGNLIDQRSGRAGEVLRRRENRRTATAATLNTLANAISGCAVSARECRRVLSVARAARRDGAATTWQALALRVRYPAFRPAATFTAAQRSAVYSPALDSAPRSWTLALKFIGNGRQFDGPGNITVAADGDLWINNNYSKSADPTKICGSRNIFRLSPFLPGTPVATFSGGGLDGSGFGITSDPRGHIWVSNFGFQGRLCAVPPASDSVSEFDPDGAALSGDDGYTGGISWPQGIASDSRGNMYVGNCGNNSLSRLAAGRPDTPRTVATGITKAFGVTVDAADRVWVTSIGNNALYGFDRTGAPVSGSPFRGGGLRLPLGVTADSAGNKWVANSGVIDLPCGSGPQRQVPQPEKRHTLTLVDSAGSVSRLTGGGLTIPWGISLDGDQNVWVANFAGQRLSHFCGHRSRTCPRGKDTGEPISPGAGYGFDGLQRNTAAQVDTAGNVWVTNNWKKVPALINPGGDGVVVFVGLAAPVAAPVVGPPHRP